MDKDSEVTYAILRHPDDIPGWGYGTLWEAFKNALEDIPYYPELQIAVIKDDVIIGRIPV